LALEDFTTYTEVDPESDIEVTANKCAVTTMERATAAYVWKDFGTDHFGDFEHLHKFVLQAEVDSCWAGVWALSNSYHVVWDMYSNNDGLGVELQTTAGGETRLNLRDYENTNVDFFVLGGAVYTGYCTTERAGTTCTCKLYSDASRTNLIDTLSITCTTTPCQWLHAALGCGVTAGILISFDSEDLDLQEVPPPPPAHFMQPRKYW